ncbi:MAG: hypothetical protein ACREXG_05930 [Polaromonas sp.]
MKILTLLTVILASTFLAACASGNLAVKDSQGKIMEVEVATFKLHEMQVVWKDNPKFDWELRSAVSAGNLQRVHTSNPKALDRAQTDMKGMYSLLKTHVADDLMSAFKSVGVRAGNLQTIEIYPARGYWSEFGWGSGVVLDVTITDQQSGKTWKHTVQADTGLQMVGALSAAPQDRSYVQSFVSGFQRVLSQGRLL